MISHDYIVFEKLFSKCFPSKRKLKPSVFKFHQFEEFSESCISVDARANHRNEVVFSNFDKV